MAVEFALFLFVGMSLFALVGEMLRFSLFDQMLARSAHAAARAVAGLPAPTGCAAAIQTAFQNDRVGRWLFDRNGDGALGIAVETLTTDTWPARDETQEVQVAISWDTNPQGGVDWSDGTAGACGGTGSWLRLRAQIVLRPWFGPFRTASPNGLLVRQESWGRNVRE